jgi:hypothetical protein
MVMVPPFPFEPSDFDFQGHDVNADQRANGQPSPSGKVLLEAAHTIPNFPLIESNALRLLAHLGQNCSVGENSQAFSFNTSCVLDANKVSLSKPFRQSRLLQAGPSQ